MGIEWYRQYHGTPTDPKWRVVAARSGQHLAFVVAVWTMLEDHASQAEPRGSITAIDIDVLAAGINLEAEQVRAIMKAMKGLVHDGKRLTAWDRRQPEGGSTVRTRAWRERQRGHGDGGDVTLRHGDAAVTAVTSRDGRVDKTRLEESREDSKQAPTTTPSLAREGGGGGEGDAALLQERNALVRHILDKTGLLHDAHWVGDGVRIHAWLAEGFHPEFDIIPVLRAELGKRDGAPPGSLKYFDKALARYHAERTEFEAQTGGKHGRAAALQAEPEAGAGGAEGGGGVGAARKARWGTVGGSA